MERIGVLYHPMNEAAYYKAKEIEEFLSSSGVSVWLCSAWEEGKAKAQVDSTDLARANRMIGTDPCLPGKAGYDVNLDGRVDATDMAMVNRLNGNSAECIYEQCSAALDGLYLYDFVCQWLFQGPNLSADLYPDGRVDLVDFAILAQDWGK